MCHRWLLFLLFQPSVSMVGLCWLIYCNKLRWVSKKTLRNAAVLHPIHSHLENNVPSPQSLEILKWKSKIHRWIFLNMSIIKCHHQRWKFPETCSSRWIICVIGVIGHSPDFYIEFFIIHQSKGYQGTTTWPLAQLETVGTFAKSAIVVLQVPSPETIRNQMGPGPPKMAQLVDFFVWWAHAFVLDISIVFMGQI